MMLLVKCEAIVDACMVRNWLVAHLHLTNELSFLEKASLGRLRRQSETVKLHCDNEVQDLAVRSTQDFAFSPDHVRPVRMVPADQPRGIMHPKGLIGSERSRRRGDVSIFSYALLYLCQVHTVGDIIRSQDLIPRPDPS